jgi:hypothetical protein
VSLLTSETTIALVVFGAAGDWRRPRARSASRDRSRYDANERVRHAGNAVWAGPTVENGAWSLPSPAVLPSPGRSPKTHTSASRNADVYVYFVSTREYAELIAQDGFRDDHFDTRGSGVMVQLSASCQRNENLAIVVVLLDADDLEPYVDGDVACVPARLLTAGYAELVD